MRNALIWAVLIVLLVHARVLGGEFLVYDDGAHLANNPLFQPPTLHALVRLWSAPFEGLWAPLSYTLWWMLAKLSYALFGELDPRVFHAANWVLHGIVCALVFRLCVRRGATATGGMLGALVFGLHPLCVESVAWVSELRGLLSTALGLGALLCLGPTPRGRWLAGTLFALALLAKPAAVAFLPIAWLLDSRPWRERSIALLPWLLLALGMTLVTRSLQTEETIRTIPGAIERTWIALDALAHYARTFAWPVGLCVDHGRTPEWVLQNPQWLGVLLGLGLWAAWWLRSGARWPLVSMAALLPVLGLLPFAFQNTSTVADRYAYLALLGPALWVSGWQSRSARTALAVLLVAWSVLSIRQQGYWLDDERLFGRALAVNERSAVAHNNLGLAALRAGDVSRAEQHWRSALELRPWDVRARANLGLCLFQRGEFDAGLEELRRSLAAEPRYLRARANLVRGLAQRKAWSEAGSESLRLVELHPDSAEVWTLRAQVLLAQGQPEAAEAAIDRALELIPGYGPARALLVNPSKGTR